MSKLTKSNTFSMCSILYVCCTSIKFFYNLVDFPSQMDTESYQILSATSFEVIRCFLSFILFIWWMTKKCFLFWIDSFLLLHFTSSVNKVIHTFLVTVSSLVSYRLQHVFSIYQCLMWIRTPSSSRKMQEPKNLLLSLSTCVLGLHVF